jgi:hypothetical protein
MIWRNPDLTGFSLMMASLIDPGELLAKFAKLQFRSLTDSFLATFFAPSSFPESEQPWGTEEPGS